MLPFLNRFSKKKKNLKHQISRKFVQWGGPVVPCGPTDGHAEAKSRSSQLLDARKKQKILNSVMDLTDNENECVVSVLDISLRKRKCDINNDDCSITGGGDEGGGGR